MSRSTDRPLTRSTARTTALVLFAGGAMAMPAHAQQAQTDLPVSSITLYRSGVGYFERTGSVQNDATVQLRFDASQVNDILKSMVVLDLDGGDIDGVSYGSKEPLSRRLASFAIDISDNPNLARLFMRLRGAEVELSTIDDRVRGTVLSVEERPVVIADATVTHAFVTLVTQTGIRSVDIANVTNFGILDKQLADELNKALVAIAENQADTVKTVDIGFTGVGARDVMIAYVHEMPVWKASYRLVLPESDNASEPTIQGWAIVENTTDEDWDDIRLSLVAGQPVGFVMDLYEPLFMARPEVPVPAGMAVRPRAYPGGQGAFRDDKAYAEAPEVAMGSAVERSVARGGRDRDAGRKGLTADLMAAYAPRSQASAGSVGEVFQYQLDAPVTIERQRSAMLPILSSPIEGRRVSIYNHNELPDHPMRGVELTNSTGLQLMPGPLAVFDGSAYAGDAQIGHVSTDDERLLAYAVDLDISAQVDTTGDQDVRRVRIVNGMVEFTWKYEQKTTYSFENADKQRARTIVVEHPRRNGWELTSPPSADEQTDGQYRFDVPLDPGGETAFEVSTESVTRSTMSVADADLDTLLSWSRKGRVSQTVIDAVRKASELRRDVGEAEQRIRRLEGEVASIGEDQDRIRRNMSSMDRSDKLYGRYMSKLDEQETRLEQLESELTSARDDLTRRRNAFNSYVANLNVE